jgi:hypothetical protein
MNHGVSILRKASDKQFLNLKNCETKTNVNEKFVNKTIVFVLDKKTKRKRNEKKKKTKRSKNFTNAATQVQCQMTMFLHCTYIFKRNI